MLLWNILHCLDKANFQAVIYSEQNGLLRDALPDTIPYHTSPYNEDLARRIASKLMTAVGRSAYERRILDLHRQYNPDFWYINTKAMAHIALLAKRVGVRTVAHVSEMPYLLYESVDREAMKAMLNANLVFGLSTNSCEALKGLGVDNPKLLPPSINLVDIQNNPKETAQLRKQLGIPPDSFIWGSSGSLIYRKGIDYLPKIAARMKQLGRSFYFIWMGGNTPNAAEYYLRSELTYYGHTNVLFTGSLTEDYYQYMALIDGFMMLSHEETFGMVNIEAAYLGKPIVSFNSGGITDILIDGMGHIVDSWNVNDYVDAMTALMDGRINFDPAIAKARADTLCARAALPAMGSLYAGTRLIYSTSTLPAPW